MVDFPKLKPEPEAPPNGPPEDGAVVDGAPAALELGVPPKVKDIVVEGRQTMALRTGSRNAEGRNCKRPESSG